MSEKCTMLSKSCVGQSAPDCKANLRGGAHGGGHTKVIQSQACFISSQSVRVCRLRLDGTQADVKVEIIWEVLTPFTWQASIFRQGGKSLHSLMIKQQGLTLQPSIQMDV